MERPVPILALLAVGVAAIAGWSWLRADGNAAPAVPVAKAPLLASSTEPHLAIPMADTAGPAGTSRREVGSVPRVSWTPVFFGRLVDGGGEPISKGMILLHVQSFNRAGEARAFGTYYLKPTPAGEFEWQLSTPVYEGGSVSLRFATTGLATTLELRNDLTQLRIDLGDVQLVPVVSVKKNGNQ